MENKIVVLVVPENANIKIEIPEKEPARNEVSDIMEDVISNLIASREQKNSKQMKVDNDELFDFFDFLVEEF